jgi:hypothetical protein
MLRRCAVEQIGGYDLAFETAQDLDLWLRLAECGTLANLPETLLDYRMGLGAITQRRRQRQEVDATEAVRRARARRQLPAITRNLDPKSLDASPEVLLDRWIISAVCENHLHTARVLGLRLLRLRPGSLTAWRRLTGVMLRSLRAAVDTSR